MAPHIIDSHLDTALALGDLVRWIENARHFIGTMQWKIEHTPTLQQWARNEEFAPSAAEWGQEQSEGLDRLHSEIARKLHSVRDAASRAKAANGDDPVDIADAISEALTDDADGMGTGLAPETRQHLKLALVAAQHLKAA